MNMKVTKSITVYVPGNICNLKCKYCYVSNGRMKDVEQKALFKYSLGHMLKAFRPERIGGIAEITVISGAETLMEDTVIAV